MKTHRYVYCFIIMLFLIESVYSANQEPYKRRTPWPAPGIIEAENFDTGGEGISYHDTTDKQLGNEYRKGAVDIFIGPENINIGWTDAGEWLEYTIKVKKKGQYYITARVANADNQKAAFHAEIDGKNITGTVKVPVLKTWDRFVMVNSEIFALTPRDSCHSHSL